MGVVESGRRLFCSSFDADHKYIWVTLFGQGSRLIRVLTEMGNFFISTFTLKNVFLEGSPIFPILFMLHMTKREIVRETFFDQFGIIFAKYVFDCLSLSRKLIVGSVMDQQ